MGRISEAEKKILIALDDGIYKTAEEIGEKVGMSANLVEFYITSMKRKKVAHIVIEVIDTPTGAELFYCVPPFLLRSNIPLIAVWLMIGLILGITAKWVLQ